MLPFADSCKVPWRKLFADFQFFGDPTRMQHRSLFMTEPRQTKKADRRSLRQTLALSNHWLPRLLRGSRRAMKNIGLPRIPRLLSLPLVSLFLLLRSMYYFVMRVFICEPFFKAHCASYGRNLHTGVFLHWIQGRGEIIAGDNVL